MASHQLLQVLLSLYRRLNRNSSSLIPIRPPPHCQSLPTQRAIHQELTRQVLIQQVTATQSPQVTLQQLCTIQYLTRVLTLPTLAIQAIPLMAILLLMSHISMVRVSFLTPLSHKLQLLPKRTTGSSPAKII